MKTMTRLGVSGGLTLALIWGHTTVSLGAEEIKVGGGAAPMENIFKRVEAPFEQATGIQLTLSSEGPDQAFLNVEKGGIDVAAGGLSMESWLNLMQQKEHPIANPKDYKHRVIGRDRIQVLTHKDLAAVQELSKEQLKGLFTGQVSNWKDVGGPDLPVVVVFPTKMTGTTKLWREKVLDGADWATANRQEVGDAAELKQKVAETAGAIGVAPLAAEEPASLHSPKTPEVARPVTALTKGAPSANVQKLFDFIAKEGQQYVVR